MGLGYFQPLGFGAGTIIDDRYEVLRQIGAGAGSAVFLVVDKSLENQVLALKLFSPHLLHDQTQIQRFRQEAIISRKLTHENIIRTFDFGETVQGYPFMTMEYVKGTGLDEIVKEKLPVEEALRILVEVARAVEYAHEMGVIHRDLKPANIIISEDGKIKIADFGLAQTSDIKLELTKTGECVGTPYYMAPEQVQEGATDHRLDIYALGIIAYELVNASVPFNKPNWYDLAKEIVENQIPRFADKKNGIPVWYEEIVFKAAAKKPEDRYATVKEMILDISRHVGSVEEQDLRVIAGRTTIRRAQKIETIARNRQLINYAPLIMLLSGAAIVVLLIIFMIEGAADPQAANKGPTIEDRVNQFNEMAKTTTDAIVTLSEGVKELHENKELWQEFLRKKREAEAAGKEIEIDVPETKQEEAEPAAAPPPVKRASPHS